VDRPSLQKQLLAALAIVALASNRLIQLQMENAIQTSPNVPRLAASHYLNSAPLIWSFLNGSLQKTVELIDAVPARCSEMLRAGEVEGALVPVIEYQRLSGIRLVPEVCVGSKGSVRSVVLVTRKDDLKDVHSVALDESSRTSATLLKIIFREFLNSEPDWITSRPNVETMLSETDAALIIGDPAMTFSRDDLRIFDMASLWRQFTGLGFVFAMWAVRESEAGKLAHIDFNAARDEGLREMDTIISHHETRIPLPHQELKAYLTENIRFQIDEDLEQGLKAYFELAWKHGLIPESKKLEFLRPSARTPA